MPGDDSSAEKNAATMEKMLIACTQIVFAFRKTPHHDNSTFSDYCYTSTLLSLYESLWERLQSCRRGKCGLGNYEEAQDTVSIYVADTQNLFETKGVSCKLSKFDFQ